MLRSTVDLQLVIVDNNAKQKMNNNAFFILMSNFLLFQVVMETVNFIVNTREWGGLLLVLMTP